MANTSGATPKDVLVDPQFLELLISHRAETELLDHKGPIGWDSEDSSARIAKDVMAFANSEGGGWIVIGVEEDPKGTFNKVGLSLELAATYETTAVAKWINARCDPSIRLQVHKHTMEELHFVIIRVLEFEDVPIVCTHTHAVKGNSVLRSGAIYVRNKNAECRPISSAEDLRPIIGLATRKQQASLQAMIRNALAGTARDVPTGTHSQAQGDHKKMVAFLDSRMSMPGGHNASDMVPLVDHQNVFSGRQAGQQLIRELSTKCYGFSVPYDRAPAQASEWGVAWADRSTGHALSRSGAWAERSLRWTEPSKGGLVGDFQASGLGRVAGWDLGTYLLYQQTIVEASCRFKLMAKLADRLSPSTPVRVTFKSTMLEGKRLISPDHSVMLHGEPCMAQEYIWSRDLESSAFSGIGWRDLCVDALFGLMDLFNVDVARQTLARQMDRIGAITD